MKFFVVRSAALVAVAWSYKTNDASKTAMWQNVDIQNSQCTCQIDSTADTSSFAYLRSFFSRSHSQATCLSEDDISDELRFGWHSPDSTGCHTGFYEKGNQNYQNLARCLPSNANGPAMYLIGDSHAFVAYHGLKNASTIEVHHASWQCIADAQQATDVFPDHLRQVTKANDIILFLSTSASYKDHALKLIALAKEKQLKLVLLGDFPTLATEPALCFHAAEEPGAATNCKVDKASWEGSSPRKENIQFAKQQALVEHPGTVFYHDLTAEICPGEVCDMWLPGTKHPAYMDRHHINKVGSAFLSQSWCKFLNEKGLYSGGLP